MESAPVAADPSAALGLFHKIPPELRIQIWEYLMPHNRQPVPTGSILRQVELASTEWFAFRSTEKGYGLVAILRSSQQLYEEISSQLYCRELCFRYITMRPNNRYPSVSQRVKPPTQDFGLTPLFAAAENFSEMQEDFLFLPHLYEHTWQRFTGWIVKDLSSALCRDFLYANFSRFQKIVFEIECPCADTFEHEFPVLCGKLRDIIKTIADITQSFADCELSRRSSCLPRSAKLPEFRIIFLNVGFGEWFRMPCVGQSAIAPWFTPRAQCIASDIEHCLDCFKRLRNVMDVTIELPSELQGHEELAGIVKSVEASMKSEDVPVLLPEHFESLPCYHAERIGNYSHIYASKYQQFRKTYRTRIRQMVRSDVWPPGKGKYGPRFYGFGLPKEPVSYEHGCTSSVRNSTPAD